MNKSQEYIDACYDYYEKFLSNPLTVRAYVKPTIDELKESIETGIEFDFYKDMPDGTII